MTDINVNYQIELLSRILTKTKNIYRDIGQLLLIFTRLERDSILSGYRYTVGYLLTRTFEEFEKEQLRNSKNISSKPLVDGAAKKA